MSEVKFTSVEWIVREDEFSFFGDFEVVANIEDDGDYDLIAENIQCETDAHLIAAAPAMYNALEHILENQALGSPLALSISNLLAKARGE